jgi:D-alanyl-D-alanine carboxypeptidase/D-alanyl-D-alanine-endopeptidase (penicillin-binding protein 4)
VTAFVHGAPHRPLGGRPKGLLTALVGALAALALATGVDGGLGGSPARALAPEAPSLVDAASTPAAELSARIDLALTQPFLAEAQVGVSVLDLETGQVLYQRGDTLPLNPASNVKLVTTAAALGILGPAHRYATALYREDGALSGTTIKGNVYLQGSGDPALVTSDLLDLAGTLRARGVKRISGGIVIDASRFDRDELPPGYDQKDEVASYRAPCGATVVNFNTFEVHVRPGDTVGSAPFTGVAPPVDGIDLTVTATTEAGRRRSLIAEYEPDGSTIALALAGTLGVDSSPTSFRYPVADPSAYAGQVLALALERQGIKVGRAKITLGTVPKDAVFLVAHQSASLSVLVRSVNKLSNNFMAEQILKTLDARPGPATFAGALERVRGYLGALGVPTEGMQLGNGSGLYDTNRVTPAQFTALLAAVYRDLRIRPDYLASLSIMGVDGTARSRLRGSSRAGWVRVKTGTLDGVSALTGYAGAPDRKPIAFAIILNGLKKSDASQARALQNEIAELLALHAAGEPLVTLADLKKATEAGVLDEGEEE